MQGTETWVQSLGQEYPLEKRMVTQSSILAWKNPMDRETWWSIVYVLTKSWTQFRDLKKQDQQWMLSQYIHIKGLRNPWNLRE